MNAGELPVGSENAVARSTPQARLLHPAHPTWAEVLQLERVSRHDELFRLGADSIRLFLIAVRANRQGINLSAPVARALIGGRAGGLIGASCRRIIGTSGGIALAASTVTSRRAVGLNRAPLV